MNIQQQEEADFDTEGYYVGGIIGTYEECVIAAGGDTIASLEAEARFQWEYDVDRELDAMEARGGPRYRKIIPEWDIPW